MISIASLAIAAGEAFPMPPQNVGIIRASTALQALNFRDTK